MQGNLGLAMPGESATTRLPPIGQTAIQIHSFPRRREPPERSWSKFKRVLIDNPKDTNLLQRQKLWNFQKLNRGAFRSQVNALPDIPYRVHKKVPDNSTVGTQADIADHLLGDAHQVRIVLPKLIEKHLQKEVSFSPDRGSRLTNKSTTPSLPPIERKKNDVNNNIPALPVVPIEPSFVDDPGLEFETVVRKVDVSTMTDSIPPQYQKIHRPAQAITVKKNILKDSSVNADGRKKNVKFADEEEFDLDNEPEPEVEAEEQEPELEALEKEIDTFLEEVNARDETEEEPSPQPSVTMDNRPSTASSSFSSGSDGSLYFPKPNVGHSSQYTLDPLSVLDLLTGRRMGDARYMSTEHKSVANSQKTFREKPKKSQELSSSEADRIWFKNIIGDKEVIDMGTYDGFARVRQTNESQSDSNNDASKNNSRKSFTPRITGEQQLAKAYSSRNSKFYSVYSRDEPVRKNASTPTRSRNSKGRTSK